MDPRPTRDRLAAGEEQTTANVNLPGESLAAADETLCRLHIRPDRDCLDADDVHLRARVKARILAGKTHPFLMNALLAMGLGSPASS